MDWNHTDGHTFALKSVLILDVVFKESTVHVQSNQCIAAKFWITAFSGPATCRTGPIRQLAGPDRSEDNLSRSDGQTSCLLSDQLYHQVPIQINISMNELAVDNINSFITRCPSQCLKRGLMTRKYSPCWIQLNSDKRLLFAVENKKKHHREIQLWITRIIEFGT